MTRITQCPRRTCRSISFTASPRCGRCRGETVAVLFRIITPATPDHV